MNFHGLLLINKPQGITSHDVVARVRRILQTKSVGHSGTLDPLASGLMVLLIGEGTKLSQYILEKNKAYRVRAQLGLVTDTLDTTGTVLKTSTDLPGPQVVRDAALSLRGELELPVPIYSAAKIDGKKLYEYAREGKEVQIPMKRMHFFDLAIEGQGADWIDVFIRCSKGSFIRAWVHRLGEILHIGAAMSQLERTESSPYHLDQAITLEELEKNPHSTQRGFIPMSSTLAEAKVIRIKGQDQVMMGNGLISHDLRTQLISAFQPGRDEVIKILSQESGELLALIGLDPGKGFAIRRVFRYS
ncbi:MAG: tRNA pseudouridine(55) synthase TruB [Pseudobdellovibrionaceae bacterium]